MVARAQSLTCWKCMDLNLESGVKNACSKYSVQQCPVEKDVCASLETTFYEGDRFSYMKSYKCLTKADVSSVLDKCRGLKSEFENAFDDLKDYACAIETCNYGLCNGLIVPEKPWWKTEPTEAPDPKNCISIENDGSEYRGKVAVTKSGRKCQRWDSQSPNTQNFGSKQEYTRLGLQENYCRNPDGGSGPWCYNGEGTVPRWEYCDTCGN
ncbi:plasminogen-like isoform X2 [Bolinopsis microptera]|uniref:plasminogen-like isoform X2 n=1 Tax=Bolinopsis microptera TaxID=2820187 RepID=UPI00307A59EB